AEHRVAGAGETVAVTRARWTRNAARAGPAAVVVERARVAILARRGHGARDATRHGITSAGEARTAAVEWPLLDARSVAAAGLADRAGIVIVAQRARRAVRAPAGIAARH